MKWYLGSSVACNGEAGIQPGCLLSLVDSICPSEAAARYPGIFDCRTVPLDRDSLGVVLLLSGTRAASRHSVL